MDFDAIIIGGSFAGLSAALYLARARRPVCVIDAGQPRNRFSPASHGFFAQDGRSPSDILAQAREQLGNYPTVSFAKEHASQAASFEGGFSVTLGSGKVLRGRRLILAYGVSDTLPAIPGVAERWGHSVLACPYCHGYEFSNRRLGVLYAGPMSILHAILISDWGPMTLFLNGNLMPDAGNLAKLADHGVTIETCAVTALNGIENDLSAVVLEDGRSVPVDALYIAPPSRMNSPIADQLGCALEVGRYGPVIVTDENQLTSIDGVYAAGDIARANNALKAAADGASAGIAAHASLVFGS